MTDYQNPTVISIWTDPAKTGSSAFAPTMLCMISMLCTPSTSPSSEGKKATSIAANKKRAKWG